MKFNKDFIPETVTNNVVYTEAGRQCSALNGDIMINGSQYLTKKETHELVKTAVSHNKTEVFNHLVKEGVNVHLGDLVYLACQHGAQDMVNTIMNMKNDKAETANRVTKYGWTAVEIAAINGHYPIVRSLVTSYGGNINQSNPYNHTTPLENAIEGGHLDTVKDMVKMGARYGTTVNNVDNLESAAKLVISQGELINPGQEYDEIKDFLLGHHKANNTSFPLAIGTKLDKLSRIDSIKRTTTTTVVTEEIKLTSI